MKQQLINLPVAGSKYRPNDERSFLVHACVETEDGYMPICNRVKADSILDDITQAESKPTCPACLKKVGK